MTSAAEGATIGVLGGGQLGRMLALAGARLGLRFRFYDRSADVCARHVGELHVGSWEDEAALARFADGVHVVTYEFENVPATAAALLEERGVPVYPPPRALLITQDRAYEKECFRKLEVRTHGYVEISDAGALRTAARKMGLPAVLKSARLGYDGKGQYVLRTQEDVKQAAGIVSDARYILERFVPYDRELSLLAVRSSRGETAFYPLTQNTHIGGILAYCIAPATLDYSHLPPAARPPDAEPLPATRLAQERRAAALQALAEDYATVLMERMDYVGLMAIEFFEVDGWLLANEMAPRVHNSGHWTIDGAETSQFENHLRAILGLPLGGTAARGHCAMVNLLGSAPPIERLLALPEAHVHLYDKSPAPGRKIGHVTVCARTPAEMSERLAAVQRVVAG